VAVIDFTPTQYGFDRRRASVVSKKWTDESIVSQMPVLHLPGAFFASKEIESCCDSFQALASGWASPSEKWCMISQLPR
jgi:hypothetical protein